MKPKTFKFGDFYLVVGEFGFSLWDTKENKWFLDASLLAEDRLLRISKNKDKLHFVKKSKWAFELKKKE